jgi:hypothetical protein
MKDINDLWKFTIAACVLCLIIGFVTGLIIGQHLIK